MKLTRVYGNTSEILNVFVRDATNSSGAGLANVQISSFSTYWCRNDQTSTSSVTLISTGSLGVYSSGSWVQVNSTFMLGWYQLSIPNGVFASGRSAAIHIYGHPLMAPTPIEIELSAKDNQRYFSSEVFSSTQVVNSVTAITASGGIVSADAKKMNAVTIIGTGVSGDLWRG